MLPRIEKTKGRGNLHRPDSEERFALLLEPRRLSSHFEHGRGDHGGGVKETTHCAGTTDHRKRNESCNPTARVFSTLTIAHLQYSPDRNSLYATGITSLCCTTGPNEPLSQELRVLCRHHREAGPIVLSIIASPKLPPNLTEKCWFAVDRRIVRTRESSSKERIRNPPRVISLPPEQSHPLMLHYSFFFFQLL